MGFIKLNGGEWVCSAPISVRPEQGLSLSKARPSKGW
jgi:hypothetical protein